jgi:hypothetical protein
MYARWSSATWLARAGERVWRVGVATVMLDMQLWGPGEAAFIGVARGQGSPWRARCATRAACYGRPGRAKSGECLRSPRQLAMLGGVGSRGGTLGHGGHGQGGGEEGGGRHVCHGRHGHAMLAWLAPPRVSVGGLG